MTKKFFIIAGEASGDLLGSKLIKEIKSQLSAKNQECEFVGVGGKLMQEQGLATIFAMEELSVMGFLEVIPHLRELLYLIHQTAEYVIENKPDYVITIDSPDFNFRVMKKIQDRYLGKKIHLIAPSVWAYREGRAEKISKLYDLLLAILPFEPPYFERYGLKTVFIGHPIIENMPDFSQKVSANFKFRTKYNVSNDDVLICLTPGSRHGEVSRIFPEFIGAVNLLARKFSNVKVVIPLVDKTRSLVEKMARDLKVRYALVEKDEQELAFFASNFALAKSGTNTLELSLYKLPMIVAYKINPITHFLVKRMVKIKFANLINLILNKELIPEMLQSHCSTSRLYVRLKTLIGDKELAKRQITETAAVLEVMGLGDDERPSKKAVNEILKL